MRSLLYTRYARAILIGVVAVFCVAVSRSGYADRVARQVERLSAKVYKVRLSAALSLSKSKDIRALRGLARALNIEESSVIRRIIAAALGKMVSPTTPLARLESVNFALKKARGDRARRVRKNVKKSLRRVQGILKALAKARKAAEESKPRSLFIHVGMPRDPTRKLSRPARSALQQVVSRELRHRAPHYRVATNSKRLPSKSQLVASRTAGFYIGTQVAGLRVRKIGSRAEIRCSVSVRVSPWTGHDGSEKMVADQSASATGSARVVGSASARGIGNSKKDCVFAVAQEITHQQLVPFLQRRLR